MYNKSTETLVRRVDGALDFSGAKGYEETSQDFQPIPSVWPNAREVIFVSKIYSLNKSSKLVTAEEQTHVLYNRMLTEK